MVAVQGSLQTGSYEDKDGKRVYTTDVLANRVEFLEWGDRPQSNGPANSGAQTNSFSADDVPDDFQALDEDVPF